MHKLAVMGTDNVNAILSQYSGMTFDTLHIVLNKKEEKKVKGALPHVKVTHASAVNRVEYHPCIVIDCGKLSYSIRNQLARKFENTDKAMSIYYCAK